MELIPYQRLTIVTALSKEEVINRMKEKVGPKETKYFIRVDKNIFSGEIINGEFWLKLLTNYRNSWTPEITGTIKQIGDRTEICLTLMTDLLVIIFTSIFLLIGLTMLISEIIDFNDWQNFDSGLLLFVIFPYGACWFGFNLDADRAIDELIKISKGEIKKPSKDFT